MHPNRPLRFEPVFRSYLWGGQRLRDHLNKAVPAEDIWAESWEVVDHGKDQSLVAEGPWQGWSLGKLIQEFPKEILGEGYVGNGFPLLLKYLDCNRVLSVQVHPDDRYAQQMPTPDLGKTEAWYVIQAEPGSKIYAGLKPGVTKSELANSLEKGLVEPLLHVLYPQAGDCVFIPAGTVHALGEGLLVAEIQQASDTTFRLFDWNRVGPDGLPRPLHIRESLEVIQFDMPTVEFCSTKKDARTGIELLVSCDKFVLERVEGKRMVDIPNDNRFRLVTIPQGTASLLTDSVPFHLTKGQSALLPACRGSTQLDLSDDSTVLLASLPAKYSSDNSAFLG